MAGSCSKLNDFESKKHSFFLLAFSKVKVSTSKSRLIMTYILHKFSRSLYNKGSPETGRLLRRYPGGCPQDHGTAV